MSNRAVRRAHVEVQPRVRIHELDARDHALERDVFVEIEVRDAVMRVRGARDAKQNGTATLAAARRCHALFDLPTVIARPRVP